MHDKNEKPDPRLITSSQSSRIDERATAGQLALEMMHEIRNPLEALSHLTYLTLEEKDDPEKVEKYMLLANEQMKTLNRIASQTLGFARISDSRGRLTSSTWPKPPCASTSGRSRPKRSTWSRTCRPRSWPR